MFIEQAVFCSNCGRRFWTDFQSMNGQTCSTRCWDELHAKRADAMNVDATTHGETEDAADLKSAKPARVCVGSIPTGSTEEEARVDQRQSHSI